MIAEMINMDKETVRQILLDQLNVRKVCEKWFRKTQSTPDLAPCDFYLFSKLKSALKGTHFLSVDEMK
jgi:hypothetical protein